MKTWLLFLSLLLFTLPNYAQDSLPVSVDSLKRNDSLTTSLLPVKDSPLLKKRDIPLQSLLDSNKLINFRSAPENFLQKERATTADEFLFYLLLGIFFFFAILKAVYSRYISIVFRVFFNTSLRQSQLTDQLLQSKLPSMLFNLYFCIMGGLYTYLVLRYYGLLPVPDLNLIWILMLTIMFVYLSKFIVLKFTGWVSGYTQEADSYTFIVFLICKILSIILMPIVVVLAFADDAVAHITLILSYFIIILLYLLRYLRSYSILQKKLNINRFHFGLYIIGVEIIPLLLLYKIAERLLTIYL